MSQLAVGYRQNANGRQQRSDGLLKHLGTIDTHYLRVGGDESGVPKTGKGLELLSIPPSNTCYIQAFDREAYAYMDLALWGKNISLNPQAGGSLLLPANCVSSVHIVDGSIVTSDIAANAVQQVLGMYQAAPTWTTTVNNWTITPVSVSVTTGGGQLRVEWSLTISQSAPGGGWLMGLGSDGSVQWGLGYATSNVANQVVTTSGVWYFTLGAGVHTVSMFVYNTSGGSTLSLYTGVYQSLHVTEQKR